MSWGKLSAKFGRLLHSRWLLTCLPYGAQWEEASAFLCSHHVWESRRYKSAPLSNNSHKLGMLIYFSGSISGLLLKVCWSPTAVVQSYWFCNKNGWWFESGMENCDPWANPETHLVVFWANDGSIVFRQKAKTETTLSLMPKLFTILPVMEIVVQILVYTQHMFINFGSSKNTSPFITMPLREKKTFLTSEQMNSEPCQLIHWGLSAPPFRVMPWWCSEKRPSKTAAPSMTSDPQVLSGVCVSEDLRVTVTAGFALTRHPTEQSDSLLPYFPDFGAAYPWRKNRMTCACLLAKKMRTGDRALQVLSNCWLGQEGERCRQSWSYELEVKRWTIKARGSKYTVDTGHMEVLSIKMEYEGDQRCP